MSEFEDRTTLGVGEPHPSSRDAYEYLKSIPSDELLKIRGALSSSAIEGNRIAEVCAGTLHRLFAGEPVSDRYVLGLAWFVKGLREDERYEVGGKRKITDD